MSNTYDLLDRLLPLIVAPIIGWALLKLLGQIGREWRSTYQKWLRRVIVERKHLSRAQRSLANQIRDRNFRTRFRERIRASAPYSAKQLEPLLLKLTGWSLEDFAELLLQSSIEWFPFRAKVKDRIVGCAILFITGAVFAVVGLIPHAYVAWWLLKGYEQSTGLTDFMLTGLGGLALVVWFYVVINHVNLLVRNRKYRSGLVGFAVGVIWVIFYSPWLLVATMRIAMYLIGQEFASRVETFARRPYVRILLLVGLIIVLVLGLLFWQQWRGE